MTGTQPTPAGSGPRTVTGPVTLYEKVHQLHHGRTAHHPLRLAWPAHVTFVCEPHRWSHDPIPKDGSEPWPGGVRLTVHSPDLAEPVTAVGFEFRTVEQTAFLQWRKHSPCRVTNTPHRWEDRGMRNGAGYCADCDFFAGDVIDLATVGSLCVVCATPCWWSHVKSAPGAADDEFIHQARLVCKDCCPPEADELTDALLETARAAPAASASEADNLPDGRPGSTASVRALPPPVLPWLAEFVTRRALHTLWSAVAREDRDAQRDSLKVLRTQIQDARAHLVDQMLTGALTAAEVRELPPAPFRD